MRSLNNTTNSMDMNVSKLWEVMEDRWSWHAAIHGVSKSQVWLSSWTATITNEILYEITISQDAFWRCWTKRKGEKKHHSDLYSLNPTLKQTLKVRQPPLCYVLELIHEEALVFPVSKQSSPHICLKSMTVRIATQPRKGREGRVGLAFWEMKLSESGASWKQCICRF